MTSPTPANRETNLPELFIAVLSQQPYIRRPWQTSNTVETENLTNFYDGGAQRESHCKIMPDRRRHRARYSSKSLNLLH